MIAFGGAFAGRRVLVTGHTGFKGAWCTTWLLELGAEVCGFSNDARTTPSLFADSGLEGRIRHEVGDVRDTSVLLRLVRDFRPDFVLHLAAQAIVSLSYSDPLETVSSNVLGTASLLEALRGVEHRCTVVIVTSDKCYENVEQPWGYREIDALGGTDPYSASKGAAEIIAQSFQRSFFSAPASPVRVVTVRAGNVIGGGDWAADRIVADCMRAWRNSDPVVIRRPSSTRPWQHVLEPLSGYLALAASVTMNSALNGESFNFGPAPERNHTVLELLRDLAQVWGFDDHAFAYTALKDPPFHEAGLLKLNIDKASMRLQWEPTLSYAECVEFTGAWYRKVLRSSVDPMQITRAQIAAYEDLAQRRQRAWAVEKIG